MLFMFFNEKFSVHRLLSKKNVQIPSLDLVKQEKFQKILADLVWPYIKKVKKHNNNYPMISWLGKISRLNWYT